MGGLFYDISVISAISVIGIFPIILITLIIPITPILTPKTVLISGQNSVEKVWGKWW